MHAFLLVLIFALVAAPLPATAQRHTAQDSVLAATILRELIEIRSVSGTPETVTAAEALVRRLRAAGFSKDDAMVVGARPGLGNVYARLRGTGRKPPILLMAHLDVVDARREDWTFDPFKLTEHEGWWYGRGTIDDKHGVTILVANLIRWKRAGFVPNRDIVVIATADEETTGESANWFASGKGRRLIGNPAFALNADAGGGTILAGREAFLHVQTSEKIFALYVLEVTNRGGHSSVPRVDNAIYTLGRALSRIEQHRFPVSLNETTRAYFTRAAAFDTGQVAADMRAVAAAVPDSAAAERLSQNPVYNAILRTTCVATRLDAGHADNALPQRARATVNCRILPGTDHNAVLPTLHQVIGDTAVGVTVTDEPTPSPPSPLTPEIFGTVERLAREFWPRAVVAPSMQLGATDGLYMRKAGIPTYGTDAVFEPLDEARAHGKDERIQIRRFYESLAWWGRLVEALAR